MTTPPTRPELEAAHCWERDDQVPRRPQMTEFRRRMRYHQARWREAHGHPIGTQPMAPIPGTPVRSVGSRMPLGYARDTAANLVTDGARAAARARTSFVERHQSFDHQRLWADLLSSEALAFNLFGDLASDLDRADRAVHTWWPDAPGTVSGIRFAHSPGRFDAAYLNSLRAFDAAFILDVGDGRQGVIGVDTRLHERAKGEIPKPSNLWRYREVFERSGAFDLGTLGMLSGRSELCEMWLEHLLLLSMLQHASGAWTWGRYIVIRSAANPDIAELCARYRSILVEASTFGSVTVEDLVDADTLPGRTMAALRERYVLS